MTEPEIMQQLQDMQYVHASKELHEQIVSTVGELPDKHTGFYFPLVAFRLALVGVLLLLVVGLGSSVVLAAKGSNPGTPLYPVKQLIKKIAPQIIGLQEATSPTPPPAFPSITPVPHSVQHPHYSIQGAGGEHEGENRELEVEGISTSSSVQKDGGGTPAEQKIPGHGKDNKDKNILQKLLDN